ncbi:MAG: hypothetical protein BGN97_03455 [Microbacterium sp. 69-10]|uniref:hypothetical protein n=1 Tax=Microbacterium sp. 69-10 TaxID=1895783 RepID=UPI0009680266|nr:hypothetical protein [Microbacterium sp. 69-10]OJU41777.1 MAG: hypothetical protein BGN97_03455 [Microbacterium sp. 69-10]
MTRRARVGATALGLLCLTGALLPGLRATEAAWTADAVTTSTVTAVSAPTTATGATCKPTNVLVVGLQKVDLAWSSTLPLADQRVDITKNATTARDTSQITLTGQTGGVYSYAATYDTAKLLGLLNLGDLLGGTYGISIQTGYPNTTWYAAPKTFTLNVILLGLGSSCS